jgi:hypothetical protein
VERPDALADAMTADARPPYRRFAPNHPLEVLMNSTNTTAGIAGLAFAALTAATFGTPPAPGPGASPDTVVAYFTDHHHAALLVAALTLVALLPLLLFAANLPGEAHRTRWSALTMAGATGIAAGTLVANGTNIALALGADSWLPHDPLLATALFDLQAAIYPGIGVFAGAFLIGAIVTGRAERWMPRPVAAVGAAAAVLELVCAPIGVTPESPAFSTLALPGYLLVLVWMVSTSIVLLSTRPLVVPDRAASHRGRYVA